MAGDDVGDGVGDDVGDGIIGDTVGVMYHPWSTKVVGFPAGHNGGTTYTGSDHSNPVVSDRRITIPVIAWSLHVTCRASANASNEVGDSVAKLGIR